MYVAFDRALPGELTVFEALGVVELNAHRCDFDDTGQGMQLAAGSRNVQLVASTAGLDGKVGIALSRHVAHSGQYATSELHAITFQQLLSQGPKRLDMHQHHAFVIQPDQPFLGVEIQPVDQVLHVRKAQVGDDVDAIAIS
ncbi:hypothetical protein D9M71_658040 [compost metagenome]